MPSVAKYYYYYTLASQNSIIITPSVAKITKTSWFVTSTSCTSASALRPNAFHRRSPIDLYTRQLTLKISGLGCQQCSSHLFLVLNYRCGAVAPCHLDDTLHTLLAIGRLLDRPSRPFDLQCLVAQCRQPRFDFVAMGGSSAAYPLCFSRLCSDVVDTDLLDCLAAPHHLP